MPAGRAASGRSWDTQDGRRAQLEGELEQKAWVLVKPDGRAGGPLGHERAWYKIMHALGPVYKLLAAVPDDISLN